MFRSISWGGEFWHSASIASLFAKYSSGDPTSRLMIGMVGPRPAFPAQAKFIGLETHFHGFQQLPCRRWGTLGNMDELSTPTLENLPSRLLLHATAFCVNPAPALGALATTSRALRRSVAEAAAVVREGLASSTRRRLHHRALLQSVAAANGGFPHNAYSALQGPPSPPPPPPLPRGVGGDAATHSLTRRSGPPAAILASPKRSGRPDTRTRNDHSAAWPLHAMPPVGVLDRAEAAMEHAPRHYGPDAGADPVSDTDPLAKDDPRRLRPSCQGGLGGLAAWSPATVYRRLLNSGIGPHIVNRPLFSPVECDRIFTSVMRQRERWTRRHPVLPFFTFGVRRCCVCVCWSSSLTISLYM